MGSCDEIASFFGRLAKSDLFWWRLAQAPKLVATIIHHHLGTLSGQSASSVVSNYSTIFRLPNHCGANGFWWLDPRFHTIMSHFLNTTNDNRSNSVVTDFIKHRWQELRHVFAEQWGFNAAQTVHQHISHWISLFCSTDVYAHMLSPAMVGGFMQDFPDDCSACKPTEPIGHFPTSLPDTMSGAYHTELLLRVLAEPDYGSHRASPVLTDLPPVNFGYPYNSVWFLRLLNTMGAIDDLSMFGL